MRLPERELKEYLLLLFMTIDLFDLKVEMNYCFIPRSSIRI